MNLSFAFNGRRELTIFSVLPCSFSPSVSLNIKYSSTKVELGNTIPVPSTSSPPSFELNTLANTPSEALSPTRTLAVNKTYTLVLSDPDATSRAEPVKAQMCHVKHPPSLRE